MKSKIEQAMDFVIENEIDKPNVESKYHNCIVTDIVKIPEKNIFEIYLDVDFSVYDPWDVYPEGTYLIKDSVALQEYPYEDLDGYFPREYTNLDFDFRVDTLKLNADVSDARCENYYHSDGNYWYPPETDFDMEGTVHLYACLKVTILDED